MNNPSGDTLPPKENQKPAGTEGNTPPNNGSSPDPIEELKNQVEREKARAATAQQTAETAEKNARNEKILRIAAEKKLKDLAKGSGDGSGGGTPPAGTVNADDSEAEVERLNAEKGIANLIMMTPEYQALLTKDATLKEVLLSNPLSLITEYIDAGDAVDQIKKKLDKRLTSDGVTTPPAARDGKSTPKPGEVPPPSSDSVEMKGTLSPDAAVKMSAAEWEKLPKEQRRKMLLGEF